MQAVRASWINQSEPPKAEEVNGFVGQSSGTFDFFDPEFGIPDVIGVGPSVAETLGNPGSFHLNDTCSQARQAPEITHEPNQSGHRDQDAKDRG